MSFIGVPGGHRDKSGDRAITALNRAKSRLLQSVCEAVKKDSTRRTLPKNDNLVLYLKQVSARARLSFKRKILDFAYEMEGCTAYLEARLARHAASDLDKGDYRSSRLKRYERFL